MDADQLLEQLQLQGELLAESAAHADLQAPVPACPGWTMADAVGHVARVHRRVAWRLRGGDADLFSYDQPEPALLDAEYRAGLADILRALHEAPADLALAPFFPSTSPRLFWIRRMAHETAVHRVDVQLAAGFGVSEFDPDFAADGTDELLMGMASALFSGAGLDRPRSIALTPLDANASWTVRLGPGQVQVSRESADDADLSVFGLASDLYRWVWNRADDYEVSLRGELSLADRWHAGFRVGGRPT
ncbi:MAG: maleylpyruvate isomerase family mycothiol-dependent enzyme [Jatrophihabitans sp.]